MQGATAACVVGARRRRCYREGCSLERFVAGARHRGGEWRQPGARGGIEVCARVEQEQGGAPASSARHGERRDALVVPGVGGGPVLEQQPHRLQLAALHQVRARDARLEQQVG